MFTFQFPIKFGNNGKYVKRQECHEAQDRIRQEIADLKQDLKDYFNVRIEDLKDFLLRNGH